MHASLVHCFLHPQVTAQDLDQALPKVRSLAIGGVCVPPFWVKKVSRDLHQSATTLLCAVGYPHGYQMTETKIQEIELAMELGAQALMLTLNLSAYRSTMNWPKIEMAKCASLSHTSKKALHLFLPQQLRAPEWQELAKMGRDAGADGLVFEVSPDRMADLDNLREWTPDSMELSVMAPGLQPPHCQQILSKHIDRIWSPNVLDILQTYPAS